MYDGKHKKEQKQKNATASTYMFPNWSSRFQTSAESLTTGRQEYFCYPQKFLLLNYETLTTTLEVHQWKLWNKSSKIKKVDTATKKTSDSMEFQDLLYLSRVEDFTQCYSPVGLLVD